MHVRVYVYVKKFAHVHMTNCCLSIMHDNETIHNHNTNCGDSEQHA